jgi:molecular chaperone DnaJ
MAPQRDWFDKDYYAVLGVAKDATPKEITKAFRKLARRHHPDSPDGDEARFKEIQAAYGVVGDEEKRKEYDEVRRLGPTGFSGPFGPDSGFAAGPDGFHVRIDDVGDLGDLGGLFGNLFGRGRRDGAGFRGATPPPVRGVDQEASLHLGFMEAVEGVTTTVHLVTDVPGPAGYERQTRQVKVRIPAGVGDGQRIRLKGKGGPGRNGGPPGDLYVTVSVADHDLFGRAGRNLTISVPITFPEAVLGANITVPTLDGATVTLKVPPGTESGRTFRVRGRGIETAKGTGDLLVTVRVAVPHPDSLSDAERSAIETLADVTDSSPRDEERSKARS